MLGTYGRAFWTGDITPLQELSAAVLDKPAYLFDIEPRARYGFSAQGMNYHLFGDKYLEVPNEPEALVDQLLPEGGRAGGGEDHGEGSVGQGRARDRTVRRRRGLNRALVSSRAAADAAVAAAAARRRPRRGGPAVAPLAVGDYTVTVDVAGQSLTKHARVRERLPRAY